MCGSMEIEKRKGDTNQEKKEEERRWMDVNHLKCFLFFKPHQQESL